MPRLAIQVPHTFGREEAKRRIEGQLPKARALAADLEEQWQDYTLTFQFKAMGRSVGGTMAVEDAAVHINLDLPLAAMMVKGMIEQRVREEVGAILA